MINEHNSICQEPTRKPPLPLTCQQEYVNIDG